MTADMQATSHESASCGQGPITPDEASAQVGPHSFTHGCFHITVFSDGHLVLPTSLLALGAPARDRTAILEGGGFTSEQYRPAANITLVESSGELILFDTGGVGYQPQMGHLSQNLTNAGVDTASITKVIFTHGHPDHIWGTVLADGTLRFPNAAYFSGTSEWDFWNGEDVWTTLPTAQHPFATGARRQYAAIRERVTMIRPGDEIVSGIRAVSTPGHTPGHLSFEMPGGDGLIIVGDVVTTPSVYFRHPEWRFGFDADHEQAIASRKRLLDRAATDRTTLVGYHWPYPGVAYAERVGSAFHYVPADGSLPIGGRRQELRGRPQSAG